MEVDSEDDEREQLEQAQAIIDDEKDSIPSSSTVLSSSSNFLTRVSSSPKYDKIQNLLALNKLIDEKLHRLEKVLMFRFKECQGRLKDIHDAQSSTRFDKQNLFRYVNCGKPYFRDKDNFPAPDNEDTLTMKRSGICDMSEVITIPGWTVKDKSDLLREILKMSREVKKKEIRSKIAQLKRETDIKADNLKMQISVLNKEIDFINKQPLNEFLVLPLDEEYDWDAIAAKLNRRHNAHEYKSLWKLFLHPSINKKSWSKAEHFKLQEIAREYKMQDWDAIAKVLNTGRTGYQCFVYFRTNMGNTFTGQKWTKEEEEYLRRLIDYYREDEYIPWGKVAVSMENRTKIQIYNKYARLEEQRKGRFLPEEDAVILHCIDTFGVNFRKIEKFLPGRSVAQLRTRYLQALSNKTRTSTVWTHDEDRKLIQMMANQDSSFINYASLTKYFPDKDRLQLRARYVTLVKWMKRHPNKDISKAPRRGARRLGHGQRSENLNQAVENLKTKIQCEIATKKSSKITRNSPEDAIEHAIIATLISESKTVQKVKRDLDDEMNILNPSDLANIKPTANEMHIRKILILLRAKLNRTCFLQSSYFRKMPGLTQADQVPCCFKVKSYSKKEKQKEVQVDSLLPDIWGRNPFKSNEYVIPPNYSTITGCRRLLMYFSHKPDAESNADTEVNLQYFLKRNGMLRDQLELLQARFNTLFLWPFLLSNQSPNKDKVIQKKYKPSAKSKRLRELLMGAHHGIAIPEVINLVSSVNKNKDIDLDNNPNTGTITLQQFEGLPGDLIMYIDEQ